MAVADYSEVIGELREQLVLFERSAIYRDIVGNKDAVLARFQPMFSPEHVGSITREEFLSFLPINNNKHWSGLHRQGSRMVADMTKLREALKSLVDESQPIADRLDRSTEMVFGMGKNVATGILLVAYPDKYGVWNNRSEAVLRRLGLWPEFEWGMSRGKRYERINSLLHRLGVDLGIDLWALDAFWWFIDEEKEVGPVEPDSPPIVEHTAEGRSDDPQRFGLERYLHAFLRDNWSTLELSREWQIFAEPGDDESGVEYPTDVGRIDILAKHRHEPRWLVIELKREQSADRTVGQVLRYMGWVTKHLAKPDERVSGLIISRVAEPALHYALSVAPNIDVQTYEVRFTLSKPE